MSEVSKKVKEAWQGAQDIRRACADAHVVRLADAFLHERVMRLQAEFQLAHDSHIFEECITRDRGRHLWTDADWIEHVTRELSDQ